MPRDCVDRGVAGRVQRSTPDLLRNLRNARVLVFHPKDVDGELLAQQLERIGCQVITMWPPLAELPDTVDVSSDPIKPTSLLGSPITLVSEYGQLEPALALTASRSESSK